MRHLAYVGTLGLLLFTLAVSPSTVLAAAEFEEGITLITTEELRSALDGNEDLDLINTLSPIEFRNRAIAGSINVPYEYLLDGKAELSADKKRMLVFYCKGPR